MYFSHLGLPEIESGSVRHLITYLGTFFGSRHQNQMAALIVLGSNRKTLAQQRSRPRISSIKMTSRSPPCCGGILGGKANLVTETTSCRGLAHYLLRYDVRQRHISSRHGPQ